MSDCNTTHWKPVEESRDSTTFEGSLQSKMSIINFGWKILDMLKCNRNRNIIGWFSAVLEEEVRKEANSIRNYVNKRDDF